MWERPLKDIQKLYVLTNVVGAIKTGLSCLFSKLTSTIVVLHQPKSNFQWALNFSILADQRQNYFFVIWISSAFGQKIWTKICKQAFSIPNFLSNVLYQSVLCWKMSTCRLTVWIHKWFRRWMRFELCIARNHLFLRSEVWRGSSRRSQRCQSSLPKPAFNVVLTLLGDVFECHMTVKKRLERFGSQKKYISCYRGTRIWVGKLFSESLYGILYVLTNNRQKNMSLLISYRCL